MKKNKKKKEQVDVALNRHLELVERYYKVDHENKIIHLCLHYDKVSEILESDVGTPERPCFKYELVERVIGIINSFPISYKVSIELQIGDYEGYKPQTIIEAFNDEFEFNHFCANKDTKGRNIEAVILVLVAVLVIFLKAYLSNNGILGTGVAAEAYGLILETVATLFVWEAGTVLFLSKSDYVMVASKILVRVSTLSMLDRKGKVLASEDKSDIVKHWVEAGKMFRVSSSMLCFFSGAILVAGVSNAVSGLEGLQGGDNDPITVGVTLFVYGIYFLIALLASLSGFSYYLNKGKLKKVCGVFAIVFFLFVAFDFGYNIFIFIEAKTVVWSSLLRVLISLGVDAGFAVGYWLLRRTRKMAMKQAQNAK